MLQNGHTTRAAAKADFQAVQVPAKVIEDGVSGFAYWWNFIWAPKATPNSLFPTCYVAFIAFGAGVTIKGASRGAVPQLLAQVGTPVSVLPYNYANLVS